MIVRYQKQSYAVALPGLVLQLIGWAFSSWFIGAIGSVLLCLGLCLYAKAKGRHILWGVLGWFSIIGLVVLYVLPDKTSPNQLRA